MLLLLTLHSDYNMLYIDLTKFRIVNYFILWNTGSTENLNADIKEKMKDGWIPSGPFVADNGMRFQPMVKIEPAYSERD